DGVFDEAKIAELEERFGQEHERTYGHRAGPEEPVVLVTAQLVGLGLPDSDPVPDRLTLPEQANLVAPRRRPAYLGPDVGLLETDIISRAQLTARREGPLIVEEYDATCLVPPGASAERDGYGNIVIELE
ncbi:MAG: hydantoinase/oxoprolinase family protein, partial [Alphaproteobacteria bacterium]|nr:hydantoinase/oxoprolinase family protein [Alphaproteobacteria bacterium]